MSKDFQRKDNHCTDRINDSWRKPRGSQNKQRLGKRGQPKAVDTGYRTEKSERHKWNGKEVITVTKTDEIDDIDTDEEAARIPSMGRRKKTPLVQHAVDNDVDIVNLDEQTYLEQTKEFLEARKEKQERQAAEEAAKEEEEDDDEASEPEDTDDNTDEDESSDEQDEDQTSTEDEADEDLLPAEDAPTSDNTVKEIKSWLDDNDIEYKSRMLKADLLDLVDEHTEDQS